MDMEVTFYDLPVVEVELPGYLHIGIPGEKGATFIPAVDENGVMRWSNDKELENPEDVDLLAMFLAAAVKQLDTTLTKEGTAAEAKATGDAIAKLRELMQKAVTTLESGISAVEDACDERYEKLEEAVADLQYEEVSVVSISNSVDTVEKGTTVAAVTILWTLNKEPVSQSVDGEEVEASARSVTLEGLSLTDDKTWTLKAVDEREAEATATTSVKFLNGIYYGALEYGAAMDSAAILGLTRKLQSTKTVTFTVPPGEGKRPAYALPSNGYGTPTFKIGGFEYEWEKVSTFQFTNASGYTESYDVWMHGQDVSGTITVNVS